MIEPDNPTDVLEMLNSIKAGTRKRANELCDQLEDEFTLRQHPKWRALRDILANCALDQSF